MKVAITDACIFIDILGLGISSNFFQLEIEIHTTYEVWNELYDEQQEILKAYQSVGMLTVHILESDDFQEIAKSNYPNALSPPDQTVLYLANKLDAFLLSSDGNVRKQAKQRAIQVHGLFWIFDELVNKNLLAKEAACSLLDKLFERNLMYRNNQKLWKEANKRLRDWRN